MQCVCRQPSIHDSHMLARSTQRSTCSLADTTSRVLSGNFEKLTGSLVVECYTEKNTGPARAQEMITPVMQALNDLNSCEGYEATGAVGWVGDMTGPAFFALDDAPFYMVA